MKLRGKKFRAEAKRVERKISEFDNWRITRVEKIEQDPDVLEKILRIDSLSWKKEWTDSRKIVDLELPMILNTIRGVHNLRCTCALFCYGSL